MEDQSGIVVIAMEVSEYVKMIKALTYAHYELADFFKIEKFKTLEEVEAWWEDK